MFIIPLQTIFWRNYYILASFCYPVHISKTKKKKKKYSSTSDGSIRSWDFWARYGLQVQYFWYGYFDMISYDNLIFNISSVIFSILLFQCRVWELFWWKLSCKTQQIVRIFSTQDFWLYDSIDFWIWPQYYNIENGNFLIRLIILISNRREVACNIIFSSTLTGLWRRFIPRFLKSPKFNIFMSNFPT